MEVKMEKCKEPSYTWGPNTLNNYTQADIDWLKSIGEECNKIVATEEIGESGTPHLQFKLTFKCSKRLTALKKLHPRVHWELPFKNCVKDFTYCLKHDSKPLIQSDNRQQGHRTDLESVAFECLNSKSIGEIAEKYPVQYIKFNNGIEKLLRVSLKPRQWEMDVRIYWGKPGSGKTRNVWDEEKDVYPKMVGKWWCGYTGQETVLIDDFDPNNCFELVYDFYLKLMDRYPMMIEYKGGSCNFSSKRIIFTSNYNPSEWFRDKPNRKAFFRRINTIKHFCDCDGSDVR